MQDYIDNLTFAKTFIINDNYNISEVVNTSSKKLTYFFSYYFKDYAINKCNKGSEFEDWVFVAHKDDKIIGAIKGEIMWNVLHIDLLMIIPEYRKIGIGSKLYNLAIDHGIKEKCTMATVETFDFQAPEYWKNKGFKLDFTRSGYDNHSLHFYSMMLTS